MAIVNVGAGIAFDHRYINVIGIREGDVTVKSPTQIVVNYRDGGRDEFTGVGFTFYTDGVLNGGVITGFKAYRQGALAYSVEGTSTLAVWFMNYVYANANHQTTLQLLGGDDVLNGTARADYIFGGLGNDVLNGFDGADILVGNEGDDILNGGAGNDELYGNEGDDVLNGDDGDDILWGGSGVNWLDGGAGYDIAAFPNPRAHYLLLATNQGWEVRGLDSVDRLTNIEALQFSDRAAAPVAQFVEPPAAHFAQIETILRGGATSAANIELTAKLTVGLGRSAYSPISALREVVNAADSTTTVATMSYQFFTGKMPTLAGIDFLVSPTGPNPNNLNSALYAKFDTVNRFINFAANLGKYGEAKDSFAAKYGSMTLAQATKDAYAIIFGFTPLDDKVAQLLDGRVDYLASFTQDTPTGIGTKAAMVGFLLAAAATENVGMYAGASDAFLFDLANGKASFGIDLVGVYGKPEYAMF